MEAVWCRSYPPGVPAHIDPDALGTVVTLFERAVARWPDRVAFHHRGVDLSYRDLEEQANRLAAFLAAELALPPRARVALMCPNILAFPISMLGVLKAGLVLVNVNPFYTASELRHQLRDSGALAVMAVDTALDVVAEAVSGTAVQHVVQIGRAGLQPSREALVSIAGISMNDLGSVLEGAVETRVGAEVVPDPTPDDLALLQYTGGTTGPAKGAMLTHRNLVASVMGFDPFLGRPPPEPEIVVTATPLYHILGLCVNCLTFLNRGGLVLLIDDPRDLDGLVRSLEGWPFSVITGVNTLFNGLLNTPGFEKLDFSRLRLSMGGGTPIQETVSRQWREVCGHYIKEGYGMSETGGLTQTPMEPDEYRSTIGLPYPSLEVSLRDEAGHEVALGEPGEICVRGPSVTRGYWGAAASAGDAFTEDGFFRTGDVAVMAPDGYLRIVDRRKDMILVSGFNVYPSDVEAVASSAPGVFECACIGVPDARTGEAVKLFVVPRDQAFSEEAVLDHCRQHLARYKVPRQMSVIEALPKSPVGKILRRELRERV